MKKLLVILLLLPGCSWKTDTQPYDKLGTTEEVVEFAWLPTACPNNITYWLKNIKLDCKYESEAWNYFNTHPAVISSCQCKGLP